MPYIKQEWNNYDNNLSVEENTNRNAVITPQLMEHIEDGIVEIGRKTFNKVEVTMTDADTPASGEVVDETLTLTIPESSNKGEKGDKGDPGRDGLPGENGRDGHSVGVSAVEPEDNIISKNDIQSVYGLGDCFIAPSGAIYVITAETEYKYSVLDTNVLICGEKGPKGEPGIDGVNGTDGKSAYEIAVDNGFEGDETAWLTSMKGSDGADGANGTDGEKGADGKSAYEIAVENGYIGTEVEWLTSLRGIDGVDGAPGERGEKGDKGDKGDAGATGPKGDKGDKGDQGEQGIQGEKGLTGGVGTWFEIINSVCSTMAESAWTRNGIYRGEDLTSLGIDEILRRIRNNFEDLFIGDYFDTAISTEYTANETVRNVIAGFDLLYRSGIETLDTKVYTHHAVIVPKNAFTHADKMNATATTAGGYDGSVMRTTILPKYANAIRTALNGGLIPYKDCLSTEVNTSNTNAAFNNAKGVSSKFDWTRSNVGLALMNEMNVFGAKVSTVSYYDIGLLSYQFPIFRLNPTFTICALGGTDYPEENGCSQFWLKNVVSTTAFSASYNTAASSRGANIDLGIRPFYLVG